MAGNQPSDARDWEPGPASIETEQLMESQDVPEEDRDEVRRFSEFLKRRKDKKNGKPVQPMTPEMREWLNLDGK